ncbi:NAD-dependent protein deacylase [Alteribacillus sp. HJP-4]|uniref:NAD-dependent protein deacylase n=1 Tax=Alteribacillus sp. HJP-4 TaxID=2775394 RepID=UPI0035CCE7A7
MREISEWIQASRYTVLMTGAGMSTESGLPDFRSADGLWNNKNPAELASVNALTNNREEFIAFYKERMKVIAETKPNMGHYYLAEWEKAEKIQGVITQNVDGLHQAAGSRRVAELHGSLTALHCYSCSERYDYTKYLRDEITCSSCGGFLRPDVVLFGEMLPDEAISFSQQHTANADLFIVLGSSLSVSPASYFPQDAKQNGARLVIINHTETELDSIADKVIQGRNISDVLSSIDVLFDESLK